ncbi:CIC11C00000000311 [Sungouiella intermedia]|uniref:Vacuolar protein sorting-associated protein 41 n=2 Tax=Sungouiella intermedia TaxID=45354 RepID=A0A1L0D5V1_9ASCO|nr:CIC11C00000000311 [[Candida] intermedia]
MSVLPVNSLNRDGKPEVLNGDLRTESDAGDVNDTAHQATDKKEVAGEVEGENEAKQGKDSENGNLSTPGKEMNSDSSDADETVVENGTSCQPADGIEDGKDEKGHKDEADEDKKYNGHDEVEEEDDDDDDEDEEDDEPPTFKYTRLKGLPANFFTNHPVSTATFNEKVFLFGTHTGLIHLALPDMTPLRTFKGHNASVLSLYTDGTYFASGSMDGTIIIGSVVDEKDIVKFDFKRPIHAVVLDKNYLKSKTFVYGGMSEEVTLCSRNWLDQRVDTVLERNKGPIVGINTIDDLIFWMNDSGITFYHIMSRQVVTVIANPSDSFRSDLYWPRVSFPETDRVLIAWGNYIWSLRVSIKGSSNGGNGAGTSIKSRYFPPAPSLSFRATQDKKVEIEHVFKVDYLISGIASFKDDYWIVLAYNQPEKDEETGEYTPAHPDLKLLSSMDGTTKYEEEIGLESGENLGLNDYHLGHYIGNTGNQYFIFSARAGVIAEQVQLSDRLLWYLEHGLFYKAWEMSQHIVLPEKRLGFGVKHLDELVKRNDWESATKWIKSLFNVGTQFLPTGDAKSTLATGTSSVLKEGDMELLAKEVSSQWNMWSTIFMKTGHVEELTLVIPTDPRWNLPKSTYSAILKYWLRKDQSERIYELLNAWELELYDLQEVTSTIEEILEKQPNNDRLRRQLCKLYERSFEPSKAVSHLEKLKDPNIISFLASNHILLAFMADLPKFVMLRFPNRHDFERLPIAEIQKKLEDITKVLVESRHEISPKSILKLMFENSLDIVNYFYLEELLEIDELLVKGFEDDIIRLYSQYNRPKLLPFLTSNHNYQISKAIEICELNALVDELVFLLSQVGENKKALTLILEELEDPQRAIAFAKRQNDQEIWSLVLEHSFSRPLFIKALIESADEKSSAFYNPITILQKMDSDLKIEGLKDSVTVVTRDNDMNVIVNQIIFNIVSKRSQRMSRKVYSDQLRGVEVNVKAAGLTVKFDTFQTIALRKAEGDGITVERLKDDVVKKLYTTLKHKLEHVQKLRGEIS